MRARHHGEAQARVGELNSDIARFSQRSAFMATSGHADFSFAFISDVSDAERLAEGPGTLAALEALGRVMGETPGVQGDILAVHTYFGQFIDHDVTKLDLSRALEDAIGGAEVTRLSADALRAVPNARSPVLDLDSVYSGLAAESIDKDGGFVLGKVTEVPDSPIPTATLDHDLPRRKKADTRPLVTDTVATNQDRQALIGDPRNDENLIVSQLHVAFLRAHNALAKRITSGCAADKRAQARRELIRRYQWAVLHDYLPAICDPAALKPILEHGPSRWKAERFDQLTTPIEFSAAAFRFGHSMVRDEYDFNASFGKDGAILQSASLGLLFTFTALSGQLGFNVPNQPWEDVPASLPNNWIIDWGRMFDLARNPAMSIGPKLALGLGNLQSTLGQPVGGIMGMLAVRNLKRGYQFGLPTGQALAARLQLPVLSEPDLAECVPSSFRDAFIAADFARRTPLWFYLLAEAQLKNGRLGALGTTIVAETLHNFARHSPHSVLVDRPTDEELASGEFSLKGIVQLGLDPKFTLP